MMKTIGGKVRVQLYMPESLVNSIDDYASSMGISRSNAIVFWCSQQIIANKLITCMDEVVSACQRIMPGNEDNPKLVEQLNQLLAVSDLYKQSLTEEE